MKWPVSNGQIQHTVILTLHVGTPYWMFLKLLNLSNLTLCQVELSYKHINDNSLHVPNYTFKSQIHFSNAFCHYKHVQ